MSEAAIELAIAGRIGSFMLDLAFAAPMHGITALFGPSGCGKTTILRCIAGLERLPGRLSVAGEVWQDDIAGVFRPPHRRPIGYVFQEASLFPHLSVQGNLLYGHRRADRSAAKSHEPAEVVALLGIENLLERLPDALSGGERQRVALGRALLAQPRLLLMDEPLAALDASSKSTILPYIQAVGRKVATPIIYVSHDVAEVARLADHMIILAQGRKLADGPVAEILERIELQAATGRFEAGVVLTARVTGHDDAYHLTRLELAGQTLLMPQVTVPVGERVRVRVRARDVALATRRPEAISVRNILHGTIVAIHEEPDTAFAETLLEIGASGSRVRLRARITRDAVAELALVAGSPVYALVKSISFDRRMLGTAEPAG